MDNFLSGFRFFLGKNCRKGAWYFLQAVQSYLFVTMIAIILSFAAF